MNVFQAVYFQILNVYLAVFSVENSKLGNLTDNFWASYAMRFCTFSNRSGKKIRFSWDINKASNMYSELIMVFVLVLPAFVSTSQSRLLFRRIDKHEQNFR